ncbi:MAG: hypothetical protein SFV21_16085 [Rhodospirillaceae bacterium]|nr:hypothetical protein [Rhodospirillaceae bacterium]
MTRHGRRMGEERPMYLKAVDVRDRRQQTTPSHPSIADLRFAEAHRATDDPYLDLAVELLAKRGPLRETDLAELSTRVRRQHALAAWRGVAA